MGHGGHVPHFYKWPGTGGTVSRRTANKKLTNLYWPSRKRSPKRLIVLVRPKKCNDTTKFFFPALCAGRVAPLSIRSGATVHCKCTGCWWWWWCWCGCATKRASRNCGTTAEQTVRCVVACSRRRGAVWLRKVANNLRNVVEIRVARCSKAAAGHSRGGPQMPPPPAVAHFRRHDVQNVALLATCRSVWQPGCVESPAVKINDETTSSSSSLETLAANERRPHTLPAGRSKYGHPARHAYRPCTEIGTNAAVVPKVTSNRR